MRRATEFPDSDTTVDPSQTSPFARADDQSFTEPRPVDPALVAARILIERVLDAIGTTTKDAGRDGAVCAVLVPSVAWTEPTRDAWKSCARGGDSYSENVALSWTQDRWIAIAPTEAPARNLGPSNRRFDVGGRFKPDPDETADAIWRGLHCVGFAADISWLPPDLVQAADYRLTLPTLTGADLTVIARELCRGNPEISADEPAIVLTDDETGALTPRLFRLARRQGQTADAYLLRLHDLLEGERTAATLAAAATLAVAKDSPRTAPTLDRLHGLDEAVAWGQSLARDLAAYEAGTLPWSAVDRGCLLSGPPGTGKTLFARALAATCGVPLISGSYGQWLGSGGGHQGDFLKSLRRAFADARSRAPSLLFIDEIDSFPDRARVSHRYKEWDTQVVNALLAEIDGVQDREGVVLIGACNHPDKLDPALVRSGRLDRHIQIRLPDRAALARILQEHLGADLAGEDLSAAALLAAGSSGADCERYVRGARRRARSEDRTVTMADLLDELGGGDPNLLDLGLAAIHEAGHAVVACVLCPGSLGVVSVQTSGFAPRGSAEHGGSSALRSLPTYPLASDLWDRLVILLAGRAAEEVVLGEPSAGAGGGSESDLAKASMLAAFIVSACGFEGGLLWSGTPDEASLPRMFAADPALARRVREMLANAYGNALSVVRERHAAVKAVAGALVNRRVLDGAEIARIIGAVA